MNRLLVFSFVIFSYYSSAQIVGGEIVDAGREMTTNHPFIVEATSSGWARFELAVNLKGEVTSAVLLETSLKSTPSKTILRNHAMGYKFQPGNHFPKFHHVTVKISSMKSTKMSPQEEELLKEL